MEDLYKTEKAESSLNYLSRSTLISLLANQNAWIWEISFDKINFEMILP